LSVEYKSCLDVKKLGIIIYVKKYKTSLVVALVSQESVELEASRLTEWKFSVWA